jgi:hypothetical protein
MECVESRVHAVAIVFGFCVFVQGVGMCSIGGVCFGLNEGAEDARMRDKRQTPKSGTILPKQYNEVDRLGLKRSSMTTALQPMVNGQFLYSGKCTVARKGPHVDRITRRHSHASSAPSQSERTGHIHQHRRKRRARPRLGRCFVAFPVEKRSTQTSQVETANLR